MYTLVGNPKNRSFRVLWTLEELGVPYEIDPARPASAEMRAVNPSGKAPALWVEGEYIYDSVAICQFLADRHKALTHPAGSIARARQDSLLHLVLDDFDSNAWMLAKHSFVYPEEHRAKSAVRGGVEWDVKRALAAFDQRFDGAGWLAGGTFTFADVIAVHTLQWLLRACKVEQGAKLQNYCQRASERPAYQRADAIREAKQP